MSGNFINEEGLVFPPYHVEMRTVLKYLGCCTSQTHDLGSYRSYIVIRRARELTKRGVIGVDNIWSPSKLYADLWLYYENKSIAAIKGWDTRRRKMTARNKKK